VLVALITESPTGKFDAYRTWKGVSAAWANAATEHNAMAAKIDK
jgi:hypothetical protein